MSNVFYSSSKPLPPIRYHETDALSSKYGSSVDLKPTFISVASSTESLELKPAEKKRPFSSLPALGRTTARNGRSFAWKPITFSGPILSCFVIYSVLVIVLLEILSQRSLTPENGGGLVFASDIEAFPMSSSFVFLYLPIVVAVVYSMLFSWIYLDAKRLEPWFQLSKENGAQAEDSLLLQYPFDFLPLVPFKALRRRHWGVFYSGTIMLLIFWIITPLQPAIFNTGTVTRRFSTDMVQSGTLLSVAAQSKAMNSKLLNRAYGISWLSQAAAPYTTKEFAILPFRPRNMGGNLLPSETWTTTTEAYSTNLTCKSIAPQFIKDTGYDFNNGEGCNNTFAIPALQPGPGTDDDPAEKYLLMYIGWHSDAVVSYSFGSPNCSEKFSNQYLAIFATTAVSNSTLGQYSDMQVMFCTPRYTIQEMDVTVNATSGAVLGYRPTGKISNKSISDIFNTTLFEYILSAGVNPEATIAYRLPGERPGDFPDVATRIEQYPRVADLGLKWPLTNMAGFAAGLHDVPLDALHEPNNIETLFQKTHQVLFTSAFSSLTTDVEGARNITIFPGTMTDQPAAIVLVRSIAIIVEVVFAIIGILAGAFWLNSYCRVSNMGRDPASISDIMALIPAGNTLSDDIHDDGKATSVQFEDVIQHKSYRLRMGRGAPSSIEPVRSSHPVHLFHSDSKNATFDEAKQTSAVRPIEHRIFFGVLFGGVILLASGALVFSHQWSAKNDGITIPSENPIVRSIIMNYAPTAFATFLEPMWLILSRLLCLLKPYEVLRVGGAKVSQSLGLKYTSIPPQLAIWRALRAKHVLLAVVCLITVSTNFLAVFLAGLLNEGLTRHAVTYEGFQEWLPAFKNTTNVLKGGAPIDNRDQFYVALSHYGLKNTLPPWLSEKYYFIPFDIKVPGLTPLTVNGNTSYTYQASTFGITARPRCVELSDVSISPDAIDTVKFTPDDDDASTIQFSTSHLLENGTRIGCHPSLSSFDRSKPSDRYNVTSPPGPASQAMEILEDMSSYFLVDGLTPKSQCDGRLVAGWARVSAASSGISNRSIEKTFVGCSPTVEYARFNVTVDGKGRVLSANQTGDFSTDPAEIYVTRNASESALFAQISQSIATKMENLNWHNVTYSGDWLNHFLKLRSETTLSGTLSPEFNFTNILDPNAPLPNATAVASAIDDIYAFLFATIVSLNTNFLLARPATPIPMTVEVSTQVTKLFVSNVMFILSLSILLAHFCTAVAYYSFRPARFLTRMPTNIASVIAYVSSSRALDDFVPESGKEISQSGERKEQRYGYGRFIGRDGKAHVGIERMRYVIPLESVNPEATKAWWKSLVRWRGKRQEGEVKNWI